MGNLARRSYQLGRTGLSILLRQLTSDTNGEYRASSRGCASGSSHSPRSTLAVLLTAERPRGLFAALGNLSLSPASCTHAFILSQSMALRTCALCAWLTLARRAADRPQGPSHSVDAVPLGRSGPVDAHSRRVRTHTEADRARAARTRTRRRAESDCARTSSTRRSDARHCSRRSRADWEAKLAKACRRRLRRTAAVFVSRTRQGPRHARRRTAKRQVARRTPSARPRKRWPTTAATDQSREERELRRAKDELEHNEDAAARSRRLTQAVTDAEHDG